MTCKQCGLVKAGELGGGSIMQVARLTARNHHTEARIRLAKAAGATRLAKIYLGIQRLQTIIGHLPKELSDLRDKFDNDLKRAIHAKFTNARQVWRAL